MKRFWKLNAAGDTIIEVMIVLAVLGMALGISSATASKSLNKSRNAEEHTQAVGILNSQVELLRAAVATERPNLFASNAPFCMISTTKTKVFDPATQSTVPSSPQQDTLPYPGECKSGAGQMYRMSVVFHSAANNTDYYDVRVRWDGVGGQGPQQENYTYRTHALDQTVTTVNAANQAASIKVVVKKINPPANNTTPSCSSTDTSDRAGTQVTLKDTQDVNDTHVDTTSSGSQVLFGGLKDNAPYTAAITGLPISFDSCTPTVGPVTATPGQQTVINMKIRPACYPITKIDDLGYYSDNLGTYADSLGTYRDNLGYYGDNLGYYGDNLGYYADSTGYYSDNLGYYGDNLGYYGDNLGYYGDNIGYYSDPIYTPVSWEQHTGADVHHPSFSGTDVWTVEATSEPGHAAGQQTFVHYIRYGNTTLYTRWEVWTATQTTYTAPYTHYGPAYTHYGPAYTHYSAPYTHYGPAYTHYGPPYTHFGPAYTHFSAPYTHYSLPYEHFSAPYIHYGPPYEHYSAPYQVGYCPP